MGCDRCVREASLMARAMASVPPPAAKGNDEFDGPAGKIWARAAGMAAASRAADERGEDAAVNARRFMVSPIGVLMDCEGGERAAVRPARPASVSG